ncbi:lysosomal acid lipase/cholesteryl ester hydrolase-like isoform X2 [Eublepharis macularius]|uniref:Lysosomal acid lipase/cholesteryl ester hydrolase-like isoform X2 n=1 Tax=Eublepharis macularius TaxID=481883 RepID=A0AA97L2J2_EUBMA|nr:lysosomal acid lipase/cholesteryl ester hydrolase-like isoform X2 [Eublepharis macularius]
MWLAVAVICLIQQAMHSEVFGRHLNPQTLMSTPEIIQSWGYPNEQYEVLTDDGYFLQLYRIPFGIHSHWKKDAGYDVWMLNVRGSAWSRRHQNLSIEQEEFWNFSFHEMGIYDIPATMKFILKETKQDTLYYIGHSQGATLGLIAFSIMPQLAQKVNLFMLFAPSYTMVGTGGPLLFFKLLPDGLKKFIWGNKEFCILPSKLKAVNAKLCSFVIIDKICVQIFSIIFGDNKKNVNVSRFDVYAGTFPDFTSVKTVIHWGQVAKTEEFKYFDYGHKNKAVYNLTTPPVYKLEDMTVPTAVWSAGKDIITDKRDIDRLLPRITHLIFHKHLPDWQHTDFLTGLDAPKYLYPDLLGLMEHYK